MDSNSVTWVRIPRAAEQLNVSEDTVRRMISDGRLDVTIDPEVLKAAATGRGRPPTVLVSLDSILAVREKESGPADAGITPGTALMERLREVEEELARTRAELEHVRSLVRDARDEEVARLRADLAKTQTAALEGLARDEDLDKAQRARLEAERLRIDEEVARLDADRARRSQLRAFIVPDYPPD